MPHRLDCKNFSRYLLLAPTLLSSDRYRLVKRIWYIKRKWYRRGENSSDQTWTLTKPPSVRTYAVGRMQPAAAAPLRTRSVARPSPSNRRSPRYLLRSSAGKRGRTTGLSRPPLRTELRGLVDDSFISRMVLRLNEMISKNFPDSLCS